MSLNHIELVPQLLSDLYSRVLVETIATPMPNKPAIPFLGKNKKNILLVTSNPQEAHLKDTALAFLISILAACKLSLDDTALINQSHRTSANYTELISFFKPETVLLFGVDPLSFGLPLNFPLFKIQPFNKVTYLYTPSLQEMEQDKTLKLQLWQNLKTLFSL